MKRGVVRFGAAAFLLILGASAGAASESGSQSIKTGLWQIEWHTNWGMFVVRHDWQPMEERAQVSAQALEHALYKRACVTQSGALHPDTVVLNYEGCKLETRQAGEGVAAVDGTCSGRKDGITQLHVTITSKSPDAALVEFKGTLDPAAGYPVLETYKMKWISADCGDLPPGAIRPSPKPEN